MTLTDFAEPTIPFNRWGNDADEAQVRKWYMAGFLRTNTTRPDFLVDAFTLTDEGAMEATGIDRKRWPYVCGAMARKNGKGRTEHGLVGDSEKLWVAGWDEGGK